MQVHSKPVPLLRSQQAFRVLIVGIVPEPEVSETARLKPKPLMRLYVLSIQGILHDSSDVVDLHDI